MFNINIPVFKTLYIYFPIKLMLISMHLCKIHSFIFCEWQLVVKSSCLTGNIIFVSSLYDSCMYICMHACVHTHTHTHTEFTNIHSVCFCIMSYPKLCCTVYEINMGNVKAADNEWAWDRSKLIFIHNWGNMLQAQFKESLQGSVG